jgi:hypothetical protein
MPLFELRDGAMVPFARLHPGPQLYEQEIEHLVWTDLEAFTGESLFPLARQPHIAGGGIPDILALDENGRVVVIEIKRDVDRSQLAQCLEYAGWARLTNLDELGIEAFFRDWLDFTETPTPLTINPQPRLVLIARDFQGRTRSALDFLQENSLPVTVIPVTIYQDATGRRVVDVEAEHEPSIPGGGPTVPIQPSALNARRVGVPDLLSAGLIQPDEHVEFVRPRVGSRHEATILADGRFQLTDGTFETSPSGAAMRAANLAAYDGWYAWRLPRLGGTKLAELRVAYLTNPPDDAA